MSRTAPYSFDMASKAKESSMKSKNVLIEPSQQYINNNKQSKVMSPKEETRR
jgi:hypothetical protein